MSEYKNPLRVNSDDPLCSATTLGNTVIGILFEKKGSEIRDALQARISIIDKKIEEYQGVVGKIEVFIEEKRKILKELDDYYQDRSDKKTALLKPFRKELDDLRKKYYEQCSGINVKISESESAFDKETNKDIGQKAVSFEDSFDTFKVNFLELDEFLKRESAQGIVGEPIRSVAGSQGITGCQGVRGYLGDSGTISVYNSNTSNGVTFTSSGNVGIGVDTPNSMLYVSSEPTKEDQAVARLNSLRSLLFSYAGKINTIKSKVEELDQERRRLKLIHKNIIIEREYKLDLNKLSAFGFEDIEVK